MKKAYQKPTMAAQLFAANEYVAACGDNGTTYLFECNAPKGKLYYFPESDDSLDGIYNGTGSKKKRGDYHPCNKKHEASAASDFYEGFVDYNDNGKYDPNGTPTWWGGQTPAEAVIVWHDGTKLGWHATKNLDINSWQTAKS